MLSASKRMARNRNGNRACPSCGGDVHPIAGRCKHCKADLVGSHRAETAPIALPAITVAASNPEVALLPPRPAEPVASTVTRAARWPIAVIVVSILATGVAIAALAWPNESSASAIDE